MKVLASLTFLLLISNCQCGLIDGVFGAVTNTTHGIANNVGGIFSFGQGLVFGDKKNEKPTEAAVVKDTKNLIGSLFNSVHDNVKQIHERIRNVFRNEKNTNDNGVLGSMVHRVKNRISNINGFIFGNIHKPREMVNKTHNDLIDETKPVRDRLHKFIFGNKTRNGNMNNLIKVIDDIRSKLHDIRNNAIPGTKSPDFEATTEDGAGLIDIRGSFDDIKKESEHFTRGNNIRNIQGRYELNNIAAETNKFRNNIGKAINNIESNVKNSLESETGVMNGAYKKINEETIVFRD